MTSSTESSQASVFAWPIDHPWVNLLLLLGIAGFIVFALPRAQIDFSLEQLYPQNSPLAKVYQEHKTAYGADDNSFFAVRKGEAWAPEIQEVEQKIRRLPQVESTLSPFTMERLENRDGLLQMRPLSPTSSSTLTSSVCVALSFGCIPTV